MHIHFEKTYRVVEIARLLEFISILLLILLLRHEVLWEQTIKQILKHDNIRLYYMNGIRKYANTHYNIVK